MNNKHETALALIDERIETEEKLFYEAQAKTKAAREMLGRAEKEEKLAAWSLEQVRASRNALVFDRDANSVTPEPSEVP